MTKLIPSSIVALLLLLSTARLCAQSAALIEAAKKEGGTAVVYGSLESDEFEAIKTAFQNKTGLELEIWRASGTKTMDRVVSEYRAGKPAYDAVLLNANVARLVAAEGMLAKYQSPSARGYPTESIDPVLGPSYRNVVIGIVYNKSMIISGDAPKSYEDILKPQFKGKIAMPDPSQHLTTTQWLTSLEKIIGKDRAERFVKSLAAQKPTLVESFIPAVERVTGGEVPIALTQVMYAYTYAVKGAPVDYVRSGKMMGDSHYALLNNKAPHPNAGKAFIDYLLSDDSLRILARMGEFVNRKGIYPPLRDADKIQFVAMENFGIKEYEQKKNELQKLFAP